MTDGPRNLSSSIRTVLRNLNPNVIVSSVATMEQLLSGQEVQRRFQTWLIGVFSGLALTLAALGIFAVMHYSVTVRRSEIGLRMALGATPRDIARLVLSNGTRLALVGVFAGAIMASWLTDAISGMLYSVKPGDPASFLSAALLLIGVSLAASGLPALSASRVDPMSAIRRE